MCNAAKETFHIDRSDHEADKRPRKQYLVHNRTPWQIRVDEHDCGEFQMSPLSERVVSGERLKLFEEALIPLRQRHYLRVRPYLRPRGLRWPYGLMMFGLVALAATVMYTFAVDGTLRRFQCLVAAGVFAGTTVVGLVAALTEERKRQIEEEVADREEGDILFGSGGAFFSGNETQRMAWQATALVTVLVVGVLLPAVAIYYGTDMQDLVDLSGGISIESSSARRRVVARVIQMTYVALLTLFPALMYFQFDRVRVGTLRAQWVRNIFRLDCRVKNLADVEASYGAQLSEASSFSTDSVRLLGGKRSPIVVATILLAVGWTLLVLPTRSRDFQSSLSAELALEEAQGQLAEAQSQRDAVIVAAEGGSSAQAQTAADAAIAAGQQAEDEAASAGDLAEAGAATTSPQVSDAQPDTTVADGSDDDTAGGSAGAAPPSAADDEAVASAEGAVSQASLAVENAQARLQKAQGGDFFQLITPRPSAAAMAFLGAYFFAAYLVLRGYLRGDLRPKVYNQITARLVTVVVLSYLFNVLYPGSTNRLVMATAFAAGVVPKTFLRGLGERLRSGKASHSLFARAFAEHRQLTTIDGVDIYERERLATEGISDVEALAHADMVGLMVASRLPLERIVDWVDQGVLQLHVNPPTLQSGDRSEELKKLHELGVRTGTDVLRVEENARAQVPGGAEQRALLVTALGGEERYGLLVGQVCREPATATIRQWAGSEFGDPRWPCRYLDRWGELQPVRPTEPYEPPGLGACAPVTVGDGATAPASSGNGHATTPAPQSTPDSPSAPAPQPTPDSSATPAPESSTAEDAATPGAEV